VNDIQTRRRDFLSSKFECKKDDFESNLEKCHVEWVTPL
jgi:hypothetical protein